MSRLATAFATARAERRKALIVYLCAGDPTLEATLEQVEAAFAAGADVVELGVPFSDPIADGPTIQAASHRALEGGATPNAILDGVAALRGRGCEVPLVLMGYLNPWLRFGIDRLCARAAEVGVDGLIVPDLPFDEPSALPSAAERRGLDLIRLAAPTTSPERLCAIGAATRGFLYFVSVTGVTGARATLPEDLPEKLAAARAATSFPVVVGFGISTPEQASALSAHADGVVVGSALVSLLHETKGALGPFRARVEGLAAALRATG